MCADIFTTPPVVRKSLRTTREPPNHLTRRANMSHATMRICGGSAAVFYTTGNTEPPVNHTTKPDLAQPCGSSVVRQWFGSGSANHPASGGSVVRPPLGDEPPRPPAPDHPEPHGWFDQDGALRDAYLDSIQPDPQPDPDDTDWTTL